MTQTLSGELADGQRKLMAAAVAGAGSSMANPLVTQLSNGPLAAFRDMVLPPSLYPLIPFLFKIYLCLKSIRAFIPFQIASRDS